MGAPKPLISVIVTSYNYRHYIADALDSICAQTYPNLEAVVVDNCSTDGTVPFLRERYGTDPRVRIFVNDENIGELRNCNRGFELSRGEFVSCLSADDWMYPRHLERLQTVFEQHPQLDVVYSGVYFADADRRIFGLRMAETRFPYPYVDARDELPEMLTTPCPMCWPSALFRRSVFEEVGLEDPEGGIVASDWEMEVRIALAGKRFAYLPDPSVAIRIHPEQNTGHRYLASDQRVRDFILILEKFRDHPGMARMRGREGAVAALLRRMVEEAMSAGGPDTIGPELRARVDALTRRLDASARAYDPARVRGSRISVILPVAGSPQPAIRALASTAAQTYPNWEIVLVDAGAIPLGEWLEAHPWRARISYARAPAALTPGRARNLALRMARSEYLAFLGEDDTYAPDHLASLVETVRRTGARAVAASARLVLELPDTRTGELGEVGVLDVFRGPNDGRDLSLVAHALPLDALLLYRGVCDTAGGFGEGPPLLDDYEFVLSVERSERIAFSGQTTLDVRARIDFSTTLGAHLPSYTRMLDAVYALHEAPHLARQRTEHRRAIDDAIAGVMGGNGFTAQRAADLLAVLAGGSVRPMLAGSRVRP